MAKSEKSRTLFVTSARRFRGVNHSAGQRFDAEKLRVSQIQEDEWVAKGYLMTSEKLAERLKVTEGESETPAETNAGSV